jgi:hypothetical protein
MHTNTFQTFLLALARTGCTKIAARAAGIPAAPMRRVIRARRCPSTAADPRAAAPAQERQSSNAPLPRDRVAQALEALEAEALRRALSGVEVPVFHQGRECGTTVKHSDQLLMFLLKTLKPEVYAAGPERASGSGGGRRPVQLEVDLSAAQTDDPGDASADDDEAPAHDEPGALG